MAIPTAAFVCDPHTPEYQRDLREIHRELRDEHPVYYNAERELWMISRYDDVKAALLDEATFSVERLEEAKMLPPMLVYLDGPRHDALRNLVSRGFTPRRVASLEGQVRSLAGGLLDAMNADAPVDLMSQFASQLPSCVIAALIGIPEERRPIFLHHTEEMLQAGVDGNDIRDPAAAIFAQFSELLNERRKERRDDLMSALLDAEIDGEALSEAELLGFCFLLVVGGNDTTMNLIGNGLALLMDHPEARRTLLDDPSRLPPAIEEMLRIEAPTQALPRCTTRDVELHGVRIPADSRVFLHFGAANHDERAFDDPGRFDIARNPNRHLSLGQGSHFCMGASLARMEARVAFETFLERFPQYAIEDTGRWVTSRWARSHPELRARLR